MSSFDAMLTTVSEDVREAIEEVCDEAGTFDADWCILKAAGELIVKSRTLPPVSPEDLVEGERYVFYFKGKEYVGEYESIHIGERIALRSRGGIFEPKNCDSIYGPLRFKIGGAK